MKKLIDILFKTFLVFLIVSAIWPFYQKINYLFIGLFLILSIVIIIFDHTKIKLDIVDFLLGLLPLSYLIPHIVHNNVFDISLCIYYILLELAITMPILILRRNMNEKRANDILLTIATVGCIYFFISFLYPLIPKKLAILGIYSHFGDTYINSIDRFYGTLTYCNASALLFVISTFVSLFKINEEKENKNLFRIMLFINFSGFLSTFSKMLSIAFTLVLITLIIIKIIMKKKEFLSTIKNSFISVIIPSLLFVRLFRTYLINLNLLYFMIMLSILILLYICTCKLLEYLDTKWKYSSYTYLAIIATIIIALTIKPVGIPLKINNVYKTNASIISDFILEENKDYEITWDTEGKKDNVSFELYKLYVSDYIPKVELIKKIKASKTNRIKFKTEKDFEYYFIRVNNLKPKTNLKISNLKINNQTYIINSLLIPYQYIHQIDLTKYDKESVTDRFQYYKDSIEIIKNNKSLIGEGNSTFRYYSSKKIFNHLTQDPHSYIFQLWLDVGIYGLIYVIGLIIIGIVNMLKNRYMEEKHIWFCLFCSCMIVLPFDAIFSFAYTKILLMLSFVMVCENSVKCKTNSKKLQKKN